MKLNTPQTAALAFAASHDLPFTFWRSPGAVSFDLIVSTTPPKYGAVFDGAQTPGFVVAPFRCADGNQALRLHADVLITAQDVRFRDGDQLVDAPVNDLQARIATGAPRTPLQAPAQGDVPKPTDRVAYEARVNRAVAEIKAGVCEKIVLSRIEPRDLADDYDLIDLAERLSAAHPHALVCVISSRETGTWLIATPEILLTVDPDHIQTMALAGTQWPPEGTDLADVAWDDKIVHEQALVSDFIRDAFKAEGVTTLDETPAATVQAANLCHLRSDFRAPCLPEATLAGLLRRLHPTSAVCGMPKPEARDFILTEEGDTRGLYTGYFGPTALDGKTALYVNLRSARLSGQEIFLHVGGGIVEASDASLEWEETVAKTKTIACIL